MHEVVETPAFLSTAKKSGMTDDEMWQFVDFISLNPKAGELIIGSGGCRKVRFARTGKGKSGGYRVITYYYDPTVPVYLLFAYSKNQMDNLKREQINSLANIVRGLVK